MIKDSYTFKEVNALSKQMTLDEKIETSIKNGDWRVDRMIITDEQARAAVEMLKAYCRERLPSCAGCIYYLENGDCGVADAASPETWTEAEE